MGLRFTLTLAATFLISLLSLTADNTEASALEVECGNITCSVNSTVRGESDWRDQEAQDPGQPGGGGNNEPSPNIVAIRACGSWLPEGGGQSVTTYPADNSGNYECYFSDSGSTGGGSGEVYLYCPPLPDRAANGRANVYTRLSDGTLIYKYFFCLYPTDPFAPVERLMGSGRIYTGGQGDFYLSPSAREASEWSTTGSLTDSTGYINRGVNLSNPSAFTGAWQPNFNAETGVLPNGTPQYGYYRLKWTLDYRVCNRYEYPSWLNMPPRFDCSQTGQDRYADPYTYGCNLNPALQAGINTSALFRAADCRPDWECVITGDIEVQGSTADQTFIRNGDPLQVSNPTPSVAADSSTVRDIRGWRYRNSVDAGSTPFNGTDPNSANQYFKASWRWDTWEQYQPTGTIAFYWASDTPEDGFSWEQQYAFTADFYLPTQASRNGSTVYRWVQSGATCPQEEQSPDITVVRAVSG